MSTAEGAPTAAAPGERVGSPPLLAALTRLTPLQVGLLVLAITICFTGARWALAGEGDITTFMLAGSDFTDASAVPGPLRIFEGSGNDGQFNYRYALDPTTLTIEPHLGVRLDLALRANRIGYPALTWLVSAGGQPALVPWALVGVNVAALAALGWCGALIAQRASRAPIAGILIPAWCGFLFSLSRDYADVLGAAFVVAAIALGARRRPVWFGLLLAAACLTRELYAAVIAGLVLERLIDAVRERRLRPGREDLAWALPLVAFIAWQAFATSQLGEIPLLSGEGNRSLPFLGIVRAIGVWGGDLLGAADEPIEAAMGALSLLQFVAFVVFCVATVRAIRWPPVVAGITPAWIALLGVSVMLSSDVWAAYNDFRNLSELAVLGSVIVLTSTRPLGVPAGAVGGAWAVTVLPRILRP